MRYLLSASLAGATTLSLDAKSVAKPKISGSLISFKVKQGTPHEINYQGWLGNISDTTGVTGVFNMVFRLYDASTGGTVLWNETQNNVQVDKGIFNVILGSVNTIPAGIFTRIPLWLETQVESDAFSSRKKLVSVGYAIKSEKADTADYATVAGGAPPAGAAGGDLSGTYPNPTVAKIQARDVSTAAPGNGQVLKWDGTQWAPAADGATGAVLSILRLPVEGDTFTNTAEWKDVGSDVLQWVYTAYYGLTSTTHVCYLQVNNSIIGGAGVVSHYRLVHNGNVVAGSETKDALFDGNPSPTIYSNAPISYGSSFTVPWDWSGGNNFKLQAYIEDLNSPSGENVRVNWAYIIIKAN